MENQINVGDQNTQQIGPNPNNQNIQTPEKSGVNYWILSTLLLSAILIIGGFWFALGQKIKNNTPFSQTGNTSTQVNRPTTASQQVNEISPSVLFMKTNLPDYPKHKDGNIILSTFDTKSGQKTEILDLGACYDLPTLLSPDKTKIAYISMSNTECEKQYYTNVGSAELWIYNFQNKSKQMIASDVWNHVNPQWSSDGNTLAYEKVIDTPSARQQQVYFYNLSSNEGKLVATVAGVSSGLIAISKDGNFIYFEAPLGLLKINVQNGLQTKLFTVDNGYGVSFYISPDRAKMAVFQMEGWYGGKKTPTNWKIGVMDLRSDSYKELYSGADSISLLASNLGNKPVFTNNSRVIYTMTGQNAGLWTINLSDGRKTKIQPLATDLNGISTLDISLDGKYLLYGDWSTENTSPTESWSHWHYYVMNLPNNTSQELSNFDYHTEKAIYLMN